MLPKIGSHRLPTHRRRAHRIFFDDPFLFQNEIKVKRPLIWTLCILIIITLCIKITKKILGEENILAQKNIID